MGTLYPRTEDVSTNMASLRDAVPPLKTFRQTWRPYEDAVPPTEDVSTNMASLRDTVPRLKTFRQTLRPQGMRSTRTAMSNAHCLLPTPNFQLPYALPKLSELSAYCKSPAISSHFPFASWRRCLISSYSALSSSAFS